MAWAAYSKKGCWHSSMVRRWKVDGDGSGAQEGGAGGGAWTALWVIPWYAVWALHREPLAEQRRKWTL